MGSNEIAEQDGYSEQARAIEGPDVLTLNYASLVPAGQRVATFTLGISFDDFEYPTYNDPYTISLNGTPNTSLSAWADSFSLVGPSVRFSTMGIDPSLLDASGILNLSIDEGGIGGDGYAIDFLTVGITTVPVPEPVTLCWLSIAGLGLLRRRSTATH